jgi:hypothetical protein
MRRLFTAVVFVLLTAVPSRAGVVSYLGVDTNATTFSQMTNSQATAASFSTAVPGANTITFENALPSGVTVSGGSIETISTVPDSIVCPSSSPGICGFNTTLGGQKFLLSLGSAVTFNFATPVDAFGLYIDTLQTYFNSQNEYLQFSDGSTETLLLPKTIVFGGAFLGFTDFGTTITSVTFDPAGDAVGLDDIRFHSVTAAPEVSTWAMLLLGFAGLGIVRYFQRRQPFAA